jgi:enoyl-CoA hydratase/carnithine racemase
MELAEVRVEDGIATVTFNNPPRGYMNSAQVQALDVIVDRLAADDTVRVIIFAGGVPGVFVRHYDVAEIMTSYEILQRKKYSHEELAERAKRGTPVSSLFDKIDRMPKPTIAAINGYAQGGGFELSLCCDLRVAEEGDYLIGLPEVNIGIFPGAGGTERLPRLIGEAKALEFILFGRTVQPQKAHELGLVHSIVPKGEALSSAHAMAHELAKRPAHGLAAAKASVKASLDAPLDEAIAASRLRFNLLLAGGSGAGAAMRLFLDTDEDINRV